MDEHVGRQRNQPAEDVGAGDDGGAVSGAFRLRFFETELETHHEVDPLFRSSRHGFDDGIHVLLGYTVVSKDVRHFLHLFLRDLVNLLVLAAFLGRVVLGVTLGREVTTEPHGDRSRRNLGEAGCHDDAGIAHGSAQARGQGKRDGESIRHPDHHVAHDLARGEVAFGVGSLGHRLSLS